MQLVATCARHLAVARILVAKAPVAALLVLATLVARTLEGLALINNAVRHGAVKTITVRVRETAKTLELSVIDDGCGFDTSTATVPGKKHRRLAAMRLRAQKIGGEVCIASGATGTCVTLELPLRR